MRKIPFSVYVFRAVALLAIGFFIIKFGAPSLLKLYIRAGVGTCEKIPILCAAPSEDLKEYEISKEYILELRPYRFPEMEIYLPKGFDVFQEKIKKFYYKRQKRKDTVPTVYLLCKKPGFFTGLFPQAKKSGVNDDYEFLRRTMSAKAEEVKNIIDAFFVIMKSIFIPDLGDQQEVKMARFSIDGKNGFINYNTAGPSNYFDCNVFNSEGTFFKIYIKDKNKELDLGKVLAIVSTARGNE